MYPQTLPVANELFQTPHGAERTYEELGAGLQSHAHPILRAQARTLEHLAQTLAERNSLHAKFSHFREEHEKLKKGLVYLWRTRKAKNDNEGSDRDMSRDTLSKQVSTLE